MSCSSCPTCSSCNIDPNNIVKSSSTSATWTKTITIASTSKKVVVWAETVSDNQAKSMSVTACPTGMICTLSDVVSGAGVSLRILEMHDYFLLIILVG